MLQRVLALFKSEPREDPVVYLRSSYEYHIESLKDEIRELRRERDSLLDRLMFQTDPTLVRQSDNQPKVRPHFDPVQGTGHTSWRVVKNKLEDKYRKKPEDRIAEQWAAKNEAMEQQVPELMDRIQKAGVSAGDDVEAIMKDLEGQNAS